MKAADPYDTTVGVAEDVAAVFARWRAWSDGVRADVPHARDVRYGPSAEETLDLFVPRAGAPVVAFFHGGYWRRLHKDDCAFVARGLAAHGVATAVINYALVPAVTLEEIVAQARRAAAWLRERAAAHGGDATRLVVAGHSAGGQLAAMCAVDAPVVAVATLSGLHDLRPLRASHVQAWLQLDESRAAAMSPALLAPASPCTVLAVAGTRESDDFRAQGRLLADAWRAHGCPAQYRDSPDDHFTLLERLRDPEDALTAAVASLATGARAAPETRTPLEP